MDAYLIMKTLHIVSATVLFGTGLGIEFFFFAGLRQSDLAGRLFAARTTVIADFCFTAPAALLQPLTGAWLIWRLGIDWTEQWLVLTYILYIVAGLCWLPVVAIQIRLRSLCAARLAGGSVDERAYAHLFRWWFALGWPAFAALIAIFWLMVTKPA